MIIRTYSELLTMSTFEERYNYLRVLGSVGLSTFGYDRYISQNFYHSEEWRQIRDYIIVRDNGCDLGIGGREIRGLILIHHLNPLTIDDFKNNSDFIRNPEYLISSSGPTHNAIHYGNYDTIPKQSPIRTKNDTCPWRH